jgi:hypothetical protein
MATTWTEIDRALRQAARAWEAEWVYHAEVLRSLGQDNDTTIRRQRLIDAGVIRPGGWFDQPTLRLVGP